MSFVLQYKSVAMKSRSYFVCFLFFKMENAFTMYNVMVDLKVSKGFQEFCFALGHGNTYR